ncbi:MAG: CBS domain-containing protein [Candidatus Bathyarchaeota archaeon]|jgi:CBS domain-containing protein
MSLQIDEIMIREIITLDGRATVREAVEIMAKQEISCLIIVQGESPIGIVTERDFLTRVLLEGRDPATTKVFQVMSAPLVYGNPNMNVREAVKLMNVKKIKKLPILENGHIVGMITLTDIARSIAYLEHIYAAIQKNL